MQKRAQETRGKILKAAVKLYSKYGFHGATVDLIAEQAGVNKQRIYAYFKNKAGLFEASLLAVFEEVNKNDQQLLALKESDMPNLTQIILKHYLETHRTQPDFWRLISWVNLESKPFYECLKGIKEESFSHLRTLYAKGQGENIFPKETSFEVYIFALMSISFVYFSNRKTFAFTLSPELFSETGAEKLIEEISGLFSVRS